MSTPTPRPQPISPLGSIWRQFLMILLLTISLAISLTFLFVQLPQAPATGHSTIVLVWSGVRPDMISSNITPNLATFGETGVEALDHHAAFPTTPLVNAAVMATGANPGDTSHSSGGDGSGQIGTSNATSSTTTTGIPDDTPFWLLPGTSSSTPAAPVTPTIAANTPSPTTLITTTPRAVPTKPKTTPTPRATATPTAIPNQTADLGQDQTQLQLQRQLQGGLVQAPSVAQTALKAGMSVSYEGANGTALLQSLAPVAQAQSHMYLIDDQMTYPSALAQQLLAANVTPLSTFTPAASATPVAPATPGGAQPPQGNTRSEAFTQAFLKVLLPTFKATNAPFLSVINYADPATAAALTGIGSAAMQEALRLDDFDLGEIIDGLRADDLLNDVNIIVTSDHGVEDVLQRANITAANQTITSPSSELRTDVAAMLAADAAKGKRGSLPDVGKRGVSTGAVTPATTVVLVAGGGVDAISFPTTPALLAIGDGDDSVARQKLASEITTWLQKTSQIGPIFVADSLGNDIKGVLPLSDIMLAGDRSPAIVFSFTTHALDVGDRAQNPQGFAGTTYADTGDVATWGTLSRRDVHTIFYATGPSFKQGARDLAPTGTIDIAPTLDTILGLTAPAHIQGRSLDELLTNGPDGVENSSNQFISTEAITADNQAFLEVVQVETAGSTVYIQDAYAVHASASQPLEDIENQALKLAGQE
jgi:hypothetical protein